MIKKEPSTNLQVVSILHILSSSFMKLLLSYLHKEGKTVDNLMAYLVTGGSGFVGQRLVEMLVERGAKRVVSFDISPKPRDALESTKIHYVQGDLTNLADISAASKDVECIYHIAALVGPYHPKEAYRKVNYEGTLNVLEACKRNGIKKIVMSSSPSTRFPYPDPNIEGLTEEQLVVVNKGEYAPVFLQPYAETKALGEKAVRDACGSKVIHNYDGR